MLHELPQKCDFLKKNILRKIEFINNNYDKKKKQQKKYK